MKRINITSFVLFIYLAVMAFIGWPEKNPGTNYTEYFCIIGVSIGVILLLRYVQVRRFRMREKMKKEDRE